MNESNDSYLTAISQEKPSTTEISLKIIYWMLYSVVI